MFSRLVVTLSRVFAECRSNPVKFTTLEAIKKHFHLPHFEGTVRCLPLLTVASVLSRATPATNAPDLKDPLFVHNAHTSIRPVTRCGQR